MQPCIGSEGPPTLPPLGPVHVQAVSVTHLPAEGGETASGANQVTGFTSRV